MENLELKQMINQNLFSKEFLEILLEKFSELEVICYAHKEFLKTSDSDLIKKYPSLDVSKISKAFKCLKLYVAELDANIDPLKAMEEDNNLKRVTTKPDQKHLL